MANDKAGEIIFQFNVRRINKPPYTQASVDIYPKDSILVYLGLLQMAMIVFKQTINELCAEQGFSNNIEELIKAEFSKTFSNIKDLR